MYRGSVHRWKLCFAIIAIAVGACTLALVAQPETYEGVTFPNGKIAFADRVISYNAASCVKGTFSNPRQALGAPDSGGYRCKAWHGCDPRAVALGFRLSELDDRGQLILEFVDNRLVDRPGADLFIYITNENPCRVEISSGGATYTRVAEITGYPAAIDISPFVPPEEEFRFVRLIDVPDHESMNPCPGPSIDAVGAMGPVSEPRPRPEALGTIQFLPAAGLVSLGKGTPNDILIILDSSSSMSEPVDGAIKIDTAKQALSEIVDLLPENALVGLRIFGGCETSQLLVPLAPLDRALLREEITAVDTGGPTPIAFALEQAKDDFADTTDGKMILLVSDGAETCKGDPIKKAQELIDLGYDLKINVVGFDVAYQEWARDQLMDIAAVTGGRYFDAESREELRTALQLSVPIPYHIYNSQEKEVFSGSIGYEEVQVPPDNYRVVIDTSPPLVIDGVSVSPNRMTTIKIEPTDGGYSVQLQ